MPVDQLRWITFGHVESDECGSMNDWLARGAAGDRRAEHDRVHGVAQRPRRPRRPRPLGRRRGARHRRPPHALDRHAARARTAWEAGVLYDETTRTLFCGDLFTQTGAYAPASTDDIIGPAVEAEDIFRSSSLAPSSGATLRRLADLDVATLALMHGPTFGGDCRAALLDLADDYDKRIAAS